MSKEGGKMEKIIKKITNIPRREVIYFVIFSLALFFPHEAFECAELTFECIEWMLDHLIELLFETGTHETQVIVFNLLFFTVLGYFIWRARKWSTHKGEAAWNNLIMNMEKTLGRWYIVAPVMLKTLEIVLL